jgi:hypothetical protein
MKNQLNQLNIIEDKYMFICVLEPRTKLSIDSRLLLSSNDISVFAFFLLFFYLALSLEMNKRVMINVCLIQFKINDENYKTFACQWRLMFKTRLLMNLFSRKYVFVTRMSGYFRLMMYNIYFYKLTSVYHS